MLQLLLLRQHLLFKHLIVLKQKSSVKNTASKENAEASKVQAKEKASAYLVTILISSKWKDMVREKI